MRDITFSEKLKDIMSKLSKKDKNLYEQLLKKMNEVAANSDVDHYKNLRYNLKDSKRVHIGHFVLVFQYFEIEDKVHFDDFDHHDEIYEKK